MGCMDDPHETAQKRQKASDIEWERKGSDYAESPDTDAYDMFETSDNPYAGIEASYEDESADELQYDDDDEEADFEEYDEMERDEDDRYLKSDYLSLDDFPDELCYHTVTVSSFQLSKFPVSTEEWQAIMGYLPEGSFVGGYPVTNISWHEAQKFISILNDLSGGHYRLPTEAEWEYAARGGKNSAGFRYSGSNNVNDVAWYYANTKGKLRKSGFKNPNELGLYDMSGNIYEWCADWYGAYSGGPEIDPEGIGNGDSRVIRGGDCTEEAYSCQVWARNAMNPDGHMRYLGFRLARDI